MALLVLVMELPASNHRKSFIETGQIYFWTASIHKWYPLLKEDIFRDVIVDSWQYLSDLGKVDIFAFVIMPTHLHSIWRINEPNGKESSQGSFMKYTAHTFQKMLKARNQDFLDVFKISAGNKKYEFWQRDSMGIPLYTREVALQKLNYIHQNPMARHWQLARRTSDYKYSSARFYKNGETEFKFLKNLWKFL